MTFFGRGYASSMGSDKHALEAPPYSAAPVDVVRMPGGREERDQVAVEEPLEIRIGGRPVAVTMRTPGHDEELALGFCLSEGLQPRAAAPPADLAANVAWESRRRLGSAATVVAGIRSLLSTRGASTATASRAPFPQTPHEEVV